jgi:hypothetical protein
MPTFKKCGHVKTRRKTHHCKSRDDGIIDNEHSVLRSPTDNDINTSVHCIANYAEQLQPVPHSRTVLTATTQGPYYS